MLSSSVSATTKADVIQSCPVLQSSRDSLSEFLLLLQATHYTINYPIQNKHYTKSILGDRLNILFFFFPHHAAVDITMANTTQK